MSMQAASAATAMDEAGWITVCQAGDLVTDCGVCVLVDVKGSVEQVAIFLLGTGELYALSNRDPIGGAAVLSRGITGSIGGALVVASPLYKHHFCLKTGQCLEDATACVRTWPIRRRGDNIQLQLD